MLGKSGGFDNELAKQVKNAQLRRRTRGDSIAPGGPGSSSGDLKRRINS